MGNQVSTHSTRKFSIGRFFATFGCFIAAFVLGLVVLKPFFSTPPKKGFTSSKNSPAKQSIEGLNAHFHSTWEESGVHPVPRTDSYTLSRRLSLSLTGSVPSLEELRKLEATPQEDRLNAWLDHLFSDQRYSNFIAERLARVYVGVENGPFLVYRRRRMVNWISDQLSANRKYDEMSRDLIAAKGIWTSSPATNFITVTNQDGGKEKGGPDEVKLAARTSRAFLGVSLDCVQCHDDKFGDRWKQKDFHQLAAFFAQSEVGLSGVFDNPALTYETRFKGKREVEPVVMKVPFQEENFKNSGSPRERLADWITHPENRSFSRAVVNRAWAILFGRPLVTPIDDIPIEGPVHPALEYLADEFVSSDYDLQALFRLIAHSEPFLLGSKSNDPETPVTVEQENCWAAFPLTQLRPEQVSGSIIQAASVQAIDSSSHILRRLIRTQETSDFVSRYGDKGENEFVEGSGTIPQRLVLMNGNLVDERTKPNPILNSSTRIAALAKDPEKAVESTFLSVLTRLPSEIEKHHFVGKLDNLSGDSRQRALQDIYWALINSTEFSWNR